MSAYVVSNKTINRIVTYLEKGTTDNHCDRENFAKSIGVSLTDPHFAEKLGEELLLLNVDSVNSRYQSDDPPPEYSFAREPATNMQLFKTISCYTYQACEGGCDETELYKAVDKLHFSIARSIIYTLPAWEKSEWE